MTSDFAFLESDAIETFRRKIADGVMAAALGGCLAVVGSAELPRKCADAVLRLGGRVRAYVEHESRFWGRQIAGVNVMGPDEAFDLLGPDALLIVCIWSPNHSFRNTQEWLKSFGFKNVLPVSAIFWTAFEYTGAHYQLSPPTVYGELRGRALALSGSLADEESRCQLVRHLLWRVSLDAAILPAVDRKHLYFDPRLFSMADDIVAVDVGAFDGDSLRSFLYWKGRKFGRFYAIEPDAISYVKLRHYISQLSGEISARIETIRVAVGEYAGTIHVTPSGKPGSGAGIITDTGGEVRCLRLADIFAGRRIDYLKLDIEGAESSALEGAWPIFSESRPIAAIAVYHRPTDIIDLPLAMISRLKRYRYYLRSHDEDGIDLVFYAVPEERTGALESGNCG